MQQHDDYIPKENPDKLNDIKPQVKWNHKRDLYLNALLHCTITDYSILY
jgi:hypothetical protein